MGELLDAEHATTDVLAGPGFGRIVLVMRRNDTGPPALPPLESPPARLITLQGSPLIR